MLGYHPILATRADTGEILHARLRKGSANTQRGTKRFVEELVARLRRAGATGKIIMRFDSGYWSNDTIKVLGRLGVSFTMAVRTGTKAIDAVHCEIDESNWVAIEYPAGGEAMVAETIYKGRRLIVRRTRLGGPQATLWPNWRHFAFLTDLEGTAVELDAFHRAHAVVELCIDDWKEGAGMEHCPSGDFSANAAWMCCAVLAHNLIRWSAKLGGPRRRRHAGRGRRPCGPATSRSPLDWSIAPGRRHCAGPTHWPWATSFTSALANLRAVAFAPT